MFRFITSAVHVSVVLACSLYLHWRVSASNNSWKSSLILHDYRPACREPLHHDSTNVSSVLFWRGWRWWEAGGYGGGGMAERFRWWKGWDIKVLKGSEFLRITLPSDMYYTNSRESYTTSFLATANVLQKQSTMVLLGRDYSPVGISDFRGSYDPSETHGNPPSNTV